MHFDLFYELSMPPTLARDEATLYGETLEEIALADRLGFHGVWLVEHHFMRGYSHSSKPELFLAAAARHSARIRLGLAIIPLPYHHPVHVAERIATLDILSGGRLEVGIGRGFSPAEYQAFGVPMADSRGLVDESLAVLRASFADGPVTFSGHHYRIERADILPRVLQQPHPPLWTAAVSPETFDWAAEEGLGALVGPFKPWFMIEQDIRRYLRRWRHEAAPRIGMTVGMFCLPDERRARQLAAPALSWFYRELLHRTTPVLERLYPSYEHFHRFGRLQRLLSVSARPKVLELAGMTIVGNPRQCVERIARLRDAGVTHLLCGIGAGALDSVLVRESMACIAEEVMPALGAGPDSRNP